LVTFVSPAKTAEPIEMLFEGLTQVDQKNRVLDGVEIPPREGAVLGVVRPFLKHIEYTAAKKQ